MKFYVTTKMGGKDINPIRETFTASVTKEEVPALVKKYIEEFNKRVTPAYQRQLISIEYDKDTDLKLFSEVEADEIMKEQEAEENKVVEENVTTQQCISNQIPTTHVELYIDVDGHTFRMTKDWYVNNRGTRCRNYKCEDCEVTGKEKEDENGNIKFVYDDKYQAKKWHTCNHNN